MQLHASPFPPQPNIPLRPPWHHRPIATFRANSMSKHIRHWHCTTYGPREFLRRGCQKLTLHWFLCSQVNIFSYLPQSDLSACNFRMWQHYCWEIPSLWFICVVLGVETSTCNVLMLCDLCCVLRSQCLKSWCLQLLTHDVQMLDVRLNIFLVSSEEI
jgi:hypothetical protein